MRLDEVGGTISAMRRTFLALGCLLTAMLAGFSGSALANHVFDDVPTGNAFHDEITEFAEAGCVDGFPDNTFRGTEAVKRQQAARFFTRCGGRVAHGPGSAQATTTGTFVDLGGPSMTAPANGFVIVMATGDAIVSGANPASCPCFAELRVSNGPVNSSGAGADLASDEDSLGQSRQSLAVTGVFAVAAGETRTYSAQGRFLDDNLGAITFNAEITALFVPFGEEL